MSDQSMPSVETWPVCMTLDKGAVVPCGTAYVLRRCWVLNKGWAWLWQHDCKHRRNATVRLHNADGPCGEAVPA